MSKVLMGGLRERGWRGNGGEEEGESEGGNEADGRDERGMVEEVGVQVCVLLPYFLLNLMLKTCDAEMLDSRLSS